MRVRVLMESWRIVWMNDVKEGMSRKCLVGWQGEMGIYERV